jgi:hypothetical protein
MRMLLAASLLSTACVAVSVSQSSDLTTLERPFAGGGQIRMDLSAGEYVIAGSSDNRIRLDWGVRDPERLREVRTGVEIRGTSASVTTDGPGNNFHVTIQVPARSDLVVRLTAGELSIKGIEGHKDVELHAGEVDIDVGRADDYSTVDAAIWAGELQAAPFQIVKEGLFRSFNWNGSGRYRLRVRLKAGELRLHATSAVK